MWPKILKKILVLSTLVLLTQSCGQANPDQNSLGTTKKQTSSTTLRSAGILPGSQRVVITISSYVIVDNNEAAFAEPVESELFQGVEINIEDGLGMAFDISAENIIFNSPEEILKDQDTVYYIEFSEPILNEKSAELFEESTLMPEDIEIIDATKLRLEFSSETEFTNGTEGIINFN